MNKKALIVQHIHFMREPVVFIILPYFQLEAIMKFQRVIVSLIPTSSLENAKIKFSTLTSLTLQKLPLLQAQWTHCLCVKMLVNWIRSAQRTTLWVFRAEFTKWGRPLFGEVPMHLMGHATQSHSIQLTLKEHAF